MPLEDPRGHLLDRRTLGDVAELELAAKLLGQRAQPVLTAGDEHALPALLRQQPRGRLADTRGRARHDGDSPTGGSGVVGHSAIATGGADGYTIGMITVEINMMHWQGLTTLNYQSYTPLALMNADPAGLQVGADSPYGSAKDLLAAIKANPGKMKASGTGQGGIWHLALAGMLRAAGIDAAAVPWVPSNGAAPAMQDLAAGGIDIVTCSVPEARAMLDAGKAKSLAVMSDSRNPTFPNVPTLKEATGSDWTVAAWRGIAAPKGLPANIAASYEAVLKKIYDSKEFQDFMKGRGFGLIYANAKGFEQFMAKSNSDLGAVMKAVGLAKS